MLCRLLVGPVVQFYIYWMPEYLYRARGFSLTEIAFFAWVPFLFGDLGSIGGGWVSGFLIRADSPCARRASSRWAPAPRSASSAWPSCW